MRSPRGFLPLPRVCMSSLCFLGFLWEPPVHGAFLREASGSLWPCERLLQKVFRWCYDQSFLIMYMQLPTSMARIPWGLGKIVFWFMLMWLHTTVAAGLSASFMLWIYHLTSSQWSAFGFLSFCWRGLQNYSCFFMTWPEAIIIKFVN